MTKKEAISLLEEEIVRCRMAPKINDCQMTEEWQRTIDVCEIAIAAIKAQERLPEPPKGEWLMKCNQICKWNSNVGCVKPYGVPCILENVSPTDKKATNADRILTVQEWISVEDRLPENICPVLVVLEGLNTVFNGWYHDGKWLTVGTGTRQFTQKVTYWMPLPQPPKEGA